MKPRIHWLFAAIFSLALQGCGQDPVPPENCANQIDDDGNGKTDCDDSACENVASCEPAVEICGNQIDDDNNGLIDCLDGACTSDPACLANPCGNNTLDAGEQCDGNNLNNQACSNFGFGGGVLSCKQNCTFDTNACANEICNNTIDDDLDGNTDCNDSDCAAAANCQACGNNTIDAGEECDANNLNGSTCATLGFDGGNLFCNANCTLNQSNCADEVCTGGLDEDGDTLVDCLDPNCANNVACVPGCGDNQINQTNEECDGNNFGGESCATLGFDGGNLDCDNTCQLDVTGCVIFCGNNTIDAGEQCDGNNLSGQSCTTKGFDAGTLACNNACDFDTSGCIEFCGNGQLNAGEQCDGNNLNNQTCSNFGFDGGTLTCNANCQVTTVNCANEICNDNIDNDLDGQTDCADVNCSNSVNCLACGNGQLNNGEQCDGNNLNNQSCQTQGFGGGTLACNGSCGFNTSGCANEVCNDNIDNDFDGQIDCADANCTNNNACNEIGECNDNTDNDNDGQTDCNDSDCANDAACVAACGDGQINQATEDCEGTNLNGQNCQSVGFNAGTLSCSAFCTFDTSSCVNNELCNNNIDDDNDGLVDCSDPGCAGNVACPSACAALTTAADPSLQNGNNTNKSNNTEGSCQSAQVGGGGGAEVAFQVTAARSGTMTLVLTSNADLGVYVQTACGNNATELGCADINFGAGAVETLQVPVTAGQVLFVFVDGFTANEQGAFTLSIATGEICNNGIDDDGDNLFDCGDNADCETNAACGNLPAGASCTLDNQCDGGVCLTEVQDGFPTGYCTETCSLTALLCGGDGDGVCLDVGFQNGTGLCLDGCNPQQGNANCSAGESCFTIVANSGVCFADCTADAQCAQAGFCNADSGFCSATNEICSGGVDDDADQLIDCADLDCTQNQLCQAALSSCAAPFIANDPSTQNEDNIGANSISDGSCQTQQGGGNGTDVVYRIIPAQTGNLRLTLNSAADLGVFVQTTCGTANSELGCADQLVGNATESLIVPATAGQAVFVFVGGFTPADNSAFTLTIASDNIVGNCANPINVSPNSTDVDSTIGLTNISAGSCQTSQGGGNGNDVVFRFVAAATGTINLRLTSNNDMGIFVQTTCGNPATEIVSACADADFGAGEVETSTVNVTAGQTIFIFVGAFQSGVNGGQGPFTLLIQ
jgi:hypothetical protein